MATHINSPEVSGLSCSSQESYEEDSDVKQHKSRTSKRRSRLKQLASARRQRWTDEADENDTDATTSGTTTPSASDSQTLTGQSDVSEQGGCSAERRWNCCDWMTKVIFRYFLVPRNHFLKFPALTPVTNDCQHSH